MCADVATHVIADRGLRVPGTYAEAFEVLAEARLLDPAPAATMVGMARFRNIVVHGYTRVDPDVVVRILRQHLADFAGFRVAALAW